MLHFITCEKHHYKSDTQYLVEEKLAYDFPKPIYSIKHTWYVNNNNRQFN